MGDEVPLQGAERRSSGTGQGTGAPELRGVRDSDCARRGEQGPRAHLGQCTAEFGAERDYAAYQGAYVELSVRGVPAYQEAVLGATLLGAGIFLRHGRTDDGRDDQGVFGTSL